MYEPFPSQEPTIQWLSFVDVLHICSTTSSFLYSMHSEQYIAGPIMKAFDDTTVCLKMGFCVLEGNEAKIESFLKTDNNER